MIIQIKATFAVIDGGNDRAQVVKALIDQFTHGGEVWLTLDNGQEVAAIAQDAEDITTGPLKNFL